MEYLDIKKLAKMMKTDEYKNFTDEEHDKHQEQRQRAGVYYLDQLAAEYNGINDRLKSETDPEKRKELQIKKDFIESLK
ncbi:hypothetical protein [Isachenkonia alkalipeptolytica]|uniref:Uncharacterized protein n=1 Tax=Isachenkonia alkalipeptolytica TaxID=2565777 RepID=A0AA44BF59_9CLOT|nr:hypothetical protein [Isachenkonia alkalipeptolytica]NBG89668.1 hypothetical protein [Isachenkonia alkalipeptolytica]